MNIRGAHPRVTVAVATVAIAVGGVLAAGAPAAAESGSSTLPVLDEFDPRALLSTPPTVPYEPPQLEHGGVRSPILPAAAWDTTENVIGRLAGKDLGMDALDSRECTPITAIHVPGSGETNEQRDPDVPHGRIVSGLGHDLAGEYGDDIRNLYLPYPSDAYLTTAYAPSVERGVAAFTHLVDGIAAACPTTGFVFTGYSQGADIINGWAAGALSGRADASAAPLTDRVIAVALFGNPRRGADVAVAHGTAAPDSTGILGPHEGTWGSLGARAFDSCNDGDLWCDATPAMRRIAPAVMSASLNPKDAAGTRKAVEAVVGSGAMSDPEIREAVDALLAFLIDGSSDHLQYETEVDGIPSARTEAREFLIERIGPGR